MLNTEVRGVSAFSQEGTTECIGGVLVEYDMHGVAQWASFGWDALIDVRGFDTWGRARSLSVTEKMHGASRRVA